MLSITRYLNVFRKGDDGQSIPPQFDVTIFNDTLGSLVCRAARPGGSGEITQSALSRCKQTRIAHDFIELQH